MKFLSWLSDNIFSIATLFLLAFIPLYPKKPILDVVHTWVYVRFEDFALAVVGYGFGQKYFGFPAYLTMNEEFAKGVPIQLSQLSRVPSTFGGQYDLAAYLVLVIPIMVSLAFGFKNLLGKAFFFTSAALG